MDRPPKPTEEAAESVNPIEQGLPASDPSEYVRSESQVSAEPNEALLRISEDMARGVGEIYLSKSPDRYGKKTWG